ncbi:hypothetical protein Tco_0686445 [Tanacetum coccineum]
MTLHNSHQTLSWEPTVSPLNDNEIDFRISFDESDDEDYTVIYDENSFSYKIISVDNLKTDLENDKVNIPSFPSPEPDVSYFNDLDFFKYFENEFPVIVYNDALTSKSDFLTEHIVSPQHTFGKVENYEDEDDCFIDFETEFPAIVFNNTITSDTALLCAPTVSPLSKNKIDFRISLGESDDEDYTETVDKETTRQNQTTTLPLPERTSSLVITKEECGDAEKWWNNEINGTTITWSELKDNFFHRYYPLSHTCNSKIPDDLDNGTDYFEFIYWLASKFNNYWEIDKNTRDGLWEFYVNKCAKGMIGDLDEYKEPCKRTCSDTFYRPYLDAQEANDIYEAVNREYSRIPIPARRNIYNADELCRTEEFTVIRHSIGNDEEFVTVGPSKINTVERTLGSMSCI